jgi:hypothetical protein
MNLNKIRYFEKKMNLNHFYVWKKFKKAPAKIEEPKVAKKIPKNEKN